MPKLSVVFSARERFSMADRSLAALFANYAGPYQLIVIDAGTPEPYRSRMLKSLEGRPNVEIIREPGYCLPNRARNLGIQKATGDYILFLENDNLIRPGSVELLLAEAAKNPVSIIVPWLWEKRDRHYDASADHIVEQPDGSLRIMPEKTKAVTGEEPQRTQFVEQHCYLITRPAQDKIGLSDEELNTREAIEFSVAAWKAGIPVIIVPRAQVDFHAPPPVEPEEREYYRYRWDVPRGDESHVRVSRRWNIVDLPDTYSFIREQKLRMRHSTWALIRARSLYRKLVDRLTGR